MREGREPVGDGGVPSLAVLGGRSVGGWWRGVGEAGVTLGVGREKGSMSREGGGRCV